MLQKQIMVLLLWPLVLLAGQELKSDQLTGAVTESSISRLSPEMNGPSPTASQQRSEIRSFTITSQAEDEYRFLVEYTYTGGSGTTGIRLVIWPLLSNGKRVPGILSGSDGEIRVGKGSITGSIACPPKSSHYPPATSTKLQVCFFDNSGKSFGCKVFNAATKWRMRSGPITPRGPNSISADEAWNVFWPQFRNAVKKRDRITLKRMMTINFDEGSGGSDDTRSAALQNISWSHLDEVLAKGTVSLQLHNNRPGKQAPPRLPGNGYVTQFEFGKDGRWRWAAFWYHH